MDEDNEFEITAKIIKITDKAILVRIGNRDDGTETQTWLPVNHIVRYDDHGTIIITKWLAQEKGWI